MTKTRCLKDYDFSKVLVIVFACDHCPTAQPYENRLERAKAALEEEAREDVRKKQAEVEARFREREKQEDLTNFHSRDTGLSG
jgi:hypothetical protein